LKLLILQIENKLPKKSEMILVEVNPIKLKAVCDKLDALLSQDDSNAADLMNENADILHAAFPNHFMKIDESILACDFDAALAALRSATAATV
jgi:hypothetical protein